MVLEAFFQKASDDACKIGVKWLVLQIFADSNTFVRHEIERFIFFGHRHRKPANGRNNNTVMWTKCQNIAHSGLIFVSVMESAEKTSSSATTLCLCTR